MDVWAQETQHCYFLTFQASAPTPDTCRMVALRGPPRFGPGLGMDLCGISEDRVGARPALVWDSRRLAIRNKADEGLLLSG